MSPLKRYPMRCPLLVHKIDSTHCAELGVDIDWIFFVQKSATNKIYKNVKKMKIKMKFCIQILFSYFTVAKSFVAQNPIAFSLIAQFQFAQCIPIILWKGEFFLNFTSWPCSRRTIQRILNGAPIDNCECAFGGVWQLTTGSFHLTPHRKFHCNRNPICVSILHWVREVLLSIEELPGKRHQAILSGCSIGTLIRINRTLISICANGIFVQLRI